MCFVGRRWSGISERPRAPPTELLRRQKADDRLDFALRDFAAAIQAAGDAGLFIAGPRRRIRHAVVELERVHQVEETTQALEPRG